MKGSSLGVATLLLLSAGSAIGADTHGLQHYEQVMAQPRPALEFVDGSQARNCREYLGANDPVWIRAPLAILQRETSVSSLPPASTSSVS